MLRMDNNLIRLDKGEVTKRDIVKLLERYGLNVRDYDLYGLLTDLDYVGWTKLSDNKKV